MLSTGSLLQCNWTNKGSREPRNSGPIAGTAMPIPETTDFEDLLSRIRVAPHKPGDGTHAIQLPLLPAFDEAGRASQDTLWLLYPIATKISMGRLCERVAKELSVAGHPSQREFALFIMAFACVGSAQGRAAKLNKVLSCVCDADVNLYYILGAIIPEEFQYEMLPFRVGRLRADKLEYQCKKADSDYYKRYQDAFREAWVVERAPKRVRVLDIPRFQKPTFDEPVARFQSDWHSNVWRPLVDGYFSLQNRTLFEEFWAEFVSAQDPLVTLGGPFSPTRPLELVCQNSQVAVFLNAGSNRFGFVAPAGSRLKPIDMANAHVRVPQLLGELRQQYRFERFDNSALHGSMKLFASFIAQGRRHQIDGHLNEALLHFVIALELIFGNRQSIEKSVVERAAVVTFHHTARSFEQQCAWLKGIYEVRSGYVHAGKSVTDLTLIDSMFDHCQQVFRCLLRLQAAHPLPSEREQTTLTQWLAVLDYLAKGMIAGKSVDETEFKQAFII